MDQHLIGIQRQHRQEFGRTVQIKDRLAVMQTAELIRAGYDAQESAKAFKDLAKEYEALTTTISQVLTIRWMVQIGSPPEIETSDGYTAMPKPGQTANLPTPRSEAYNALLTHLGVPPGVIAQDLLRVHWPTFNEYLTESNAAGAPPPPGIESDRVRNKFNVQFSVKTQ